MCQIQRLPQVKAAIGLSRSTVYHHVKEGLLPPPVSIGARAIGWPDHEIKAITAARIAGKSDNEIRALVKSLVVARQSGS
jgi:Predicted transcriptional regulator